MCELALAVRLFIMAARKIWEDVVEMLTLLYVATLKSCSFQVLFFVLTVYSLYRIYSIKFFLYRVSSFERILADH